MRTVIGVVVLVVVALALTLLIKGCGKDDPKPATHKASCWRPEYAANPDVDWATNPSARHRHGAGSRPGICG